jgi:hypothetical protein
VFRLLVDPERLCRCSSLNNNIFFLLNAFCFSSAAYFPPAYRPSYFLTRLNLTHNKATSPKQAAPATPITGTTPTTAFAAPVPVGLAALAVALLISLEMLAPMELAAEPREEVTEAALEPIADVAELTSDAMLERSVVCEPRAVPAAEVRDWASETREERTSGRARVVEVVVMARRRMVEEESEKRMVGLDGS